MNELDIDSINKAAHYQVRNAPYYAALIFRKDHPNAVEISSQIDYVIAELQGK